MEMHSYQKKNIQASLLAVDKRGKDIPLCCTLKIRGGVERDSYGKRAGKGALIQWEKSATLGVSQDQYLFVLKEIATDHPTNVTQ